MQGKVYLVGAGPGDPGMMTLRGAECLRRADVVLYDQLANPLLLSHANPAAETISVGKHGQSRIWTQDEINEKLLELAAQGKTVVRLKGGDPAVFARGAEEGEALAAKGVPFEIVPGVTAALAAGSCAGVPITHRNYASAVALVTGQERPDKTETSLDYDALAKFPGTLVMYMGVTTVDIWSSALLAAGKPAATPVALVRRCSLPDQEKLICTLGDVAERLKVAKLRPPVVAIIGEVVQLESTLSWFERRPLFGKRILVTRPAHQADSLRAPLQELGAETMVQPAIEIKPVADTNPLDDVLKRLAEFDWIVFSSANGVRFTLNRLLDLGLDMRAIAGCRIAGIGPATADALKQYHLQADHIPERFIADQLATDLASDAANQRFLLIRASRGREVLADTLTTAGGHVEQVVVYESTDVTAADSEVSRKLQSGEIDWVTVTSSAIANSLHRLFGDDLKKTRLASISPQTSGELISLGYEVAAEATEYTMPGVVQAILAAEV